MEKRPSIDEVNLDIAYAIARRGTCKRRQVGCVLTDSMNQVISTGYNGPPRGITNCIEIPCQGSESPSGVDLDKCEAVHAEQNALLQCFDVQIIATCYTTVSPCIHCVKLLMNTSCERIVFIEEYPHHEARELWLRTGRKWEQCL